MGQRVKHGLVLRIGKPCYLARCATADKRFIADYGVPVIAFFQRARTALVIVGECQKQFAAAMFGEQIAVGCFAFALA